MPYFSNATLFLITTFFDLISYILLLRIFFQFFNVAFYNPICQAIVKLTDFFLTWLRRLLPTCKKIDYAALIFLMLFESVFFLIISILSKTNYGSFAIAILATSSILEKVVNLMTWSVLILVIFSWFSNQKNHPLLEIVDSITSGLLRKIRNFCPPFGSLDFSPLLLIICLQLFMIIVIMPFQDIGISALK